MSKQKPGRLIIIGGGEDKQDSPIILETVAQAAQRANGPLVVVTAATHLPEEVLAEYRTVFSGLGVSRVEGLDIRSRADAYSETAIACMDAAGVVFFTGGNQLRIASQIGGTPVFERLLALYQGGGLIVGTSAGAAVMPETMLISGSSNDSVAIDDLDMAPGLGLLPGVVIDSHFAQRGRMGRLLSAIAHNPRNLGIGIDEDTAIVVEAGREFTVIGSNGVYVVDGREISYSSFAEKNAEGVISVFDARVHVLSAGDHFDLTTHRPTAEARRSV